MLMTLLCKKVEYRNYETLISPATHQQAALPSTASTWYAQERKRHLHPRAKAVAWDNSRGQHSLRSYSVTMALLRPKDRHAHRTQPQRCRSFFKTQRCPSSSWLESFHCVQLLPALPSPPSALLGADSKLQEAAQYVKATEQWPLKAEAVKLRSNLRNFLTVENGSIWSLNHYL